MSNLKLKDYQPPLVIDIGSDSVKYSQPRMNTLEISNYLKLKNEEKKLDTPDHEITINANSIFDINFVESIPSFCGLVDNDKDNNFYKKIKEQLRSKDYSDILANPEFSEVKNKTISYKLQSADHRENKFGWEPTWGGVVDLDKPYWKNLVEIIGQMELSKYGFLDSLYSETPLIFTQHSLPFKTLKHQIKQIYETAFEELKAPYVMICSQAMLNLFANNLSSGIVVDMGESGTQITPVFEGLTDYHNSIYAPFLSGRNQSLMLATDSKQSHGDISGEEYFKAKSQKESLDFCCPHPNDYEPDINELSTFSYFYSYPELFRHLVCPNLKSPKDSYKSKKEVLLNTLKFVQDEKGFKEKTNFLKYDEFGTTFLNSYLKKEHDCLEKNLLIKDYSFLNYDEAVKFKKLSLTHMIISNFENLVNEDAIKTDKYMNVIFTGGAINTKNLFENLSADFSSLFKNNGSDSIALHCKAKEYQNTQTAFSKGANYLAKMDSLHSLMISKQDYYDNGSDNLCYNYI